MLRPRDGRKPETQVFLGLTDLHGVYSSLYYY